MNKFVVWMTCSCLLVSRVGDQKSVSSDPQVKITQSCSFPFSAPLIIRAHQGNTTDVRIKWGQLLAVNNTEVGL